MRKFEEVDEKFKHFPGVETKLPQRASGGSAGYDIFSKEEYVILPGESHIFYTDVKSQFFKDNVLFIFARSGLGTKYGITPRNCVGVIDPDYYNNDENDGNIGICLENTGIDSYKVNVGDRIGQCVFTRFYITDEDEYIDNKEHNCHAGFGSTGR